MSLYDQSGSQTKTSKSSDISLVIPTHERPKGLNRLLHSVERLHDVTPSEVVIVDDGSEGTATKKVLDDWQRRPLPYRVRVIRLDQKHGPGYARNLGLKAVSGEVVAFTDDDCLVDPKWLAKLTAGVAPKEGFIGVGGRVMPMSESVISKYYTFHRILEPPPSLLYLVSANCCFNREAVIDVGGFDEGIRWAGGEDIGLSFKLARAGWKFAFAPGALVYHEYRNNLLDFIRTFRNYGYGSRWVTERHLSHEA